MSDQSGSVPSQPGPHLQAPLARQTFLDAHEPWLTPDLIDFLEAASWVFGQVELYSADTDERWGWTILYTPAICPAESLPHLAQYVGQPLPPGATEADTRALIANRPHMRRGQPQAIADAIKPYLTGAKATLITERYGGAPYDGLLVNTYSGQTPDPGTVLLVLEDVIPADVILTFVVKPGQIWNTVKTNNATWNTVKAKYPTWQHVLLDTPG